MVKKVGIITLYYGSTNFGGNLQAFALAKYINKLGYSAEQICFCSKATSFSERKRRLATNNLKTILQKGCRYLKRKLISPFMKMEDKKHNVSKRREMAFYEFNQKVIPHSERVYSVDTIKDSVAEYDAFITGSDQVWNFSCYNPCYFLEFVPSDRIKFSYAASLAMDGLTTAQKTVIENSLKNFDAVSVREENAIDLLQDLYPRNIELVADPTLLLEKEDWDAICSDRVVEEDYVFCYFLGNNKKSRKLAKSFAKEKNLRLVTIPHASAGIKLIDKKFGDIKLFDASPQQFISLIKHAKYVFTDSFHAIVFSHIYQKEYFIFNRSKRAEMNSRIFNITSIFETTERFCCDAKKENLEYINSLTKIDYSNPKSKLVELKEKSVIFLKNCLEK